MKPKKPRPRKPRERPDLRRLAAPPPADFYRLPELELRGGNLLTDGCRRVLDFTPPAQCCPMRPAVRRILTIQLKGLRRALPLVSRPPDGKPVC